MRTTLALLLLTATASAQQPDNRPLEEVKKNIKVLKGIPTSQLIPTMAFIANSLGVTCLYCHTTNAYELDDKAPKEAARKMIAMQRAMNEQYYGGKVTITCNTCHQGHVIPPATPDVANAAWQQRPAAVPDTSVAAEDAIGRLFSSKATHRVISGTVERFNGRDEPKSEPFTLTLGDGKTSYETKLSHPPEATRALFAYLLAAPPVERVKGERWTFAPDLIKRTRELPTPLGSLPDQIEYSDYRAAGDARLPYRAQWSRADYRVIYTIQTIEGGDSRQ